MREFLSGWGIRIGIIALIAVGAFVLRDRLSGSAGDLAVGDCFDEPTTQTETVEDVQHHPCTESHTAEVVFVGDVVGAGDTPTRPTTSSSTRSAPSASRRSIRTRAGTSTRIRTSTSLSSCPPTKAGAAAFTS